MEGWSELYRRIRQWSYDYWMDGPPEVGGRNLYSCPMEMLLMGTGGCAAVDVVLILKKARQDISDCVVEIEAERAPERTQGIYSHSLPFYSYRQESEFQPCRAGHQALRREILLSFNHAGKNCGVDPQL